MDVTDISKLGEVAMDVVKFNHRNTRWLRLLSQPTGRGRGLEVPKRLLPSDDSLEKRSSDVERKTRDAVSVFLPEFQCRRFPGKDHFQILGFVAKGSFGPILKVKDKNKDKIYAVKVIPKSEIWKHGALEQSKEEVIIQRQLKHPFIHNLQDCWQTQRHLFIMCDYCDSGDLYTYWELKGQFGEDEIRVFAAELGSALGFLHDCGIIHRDVKMENILLSDQGHLRLADFGLSRRLTRGGRAFSVCGTIQYMAPEVLSGGPYNHAADWWSLGIMLFSLVAGKFPVPPESDHCTMSRKVKEFPYVIPKTFSPALTLLLSELLCKNPANRLRNLERFKRQTFFSGTSFDSQILQKTPVGFILELKSHPDRVAKAMRGLSEDYFRNFDCDKILNSPTSPPDLSPTLANIDSNQATAQTCKA
ncbi:ribosomal protein S6 kinase-related protein [Lampris incognitus]|uniref:ribosomal protein S6 kinase-related protein n=1 Tax=Lampris incognitus TaxID=2546036 RepID=UPI0024B53CA0|nr:ribosomal protein S6 kinase-related protein [Lampris incognitus]